MAEEQRSQEVGRDEAEEDPVVTIEEWRNAIELQEGERIMNGPKSMVCTYPEDYAPRQSIFSCLTCQEENDGKPAGICFACSENCHQGHEVLQLYTKRNFCCDCGNSKFKNKCSLFEAKIPVNRRNKYNHNFVGRYCTCDQPYPPPPDDPMANAEMFQCCVCEDWFHAEHTGLPDDVYQDLEQEMACADCARRYPWLYVYKLLMDEQVARNEVAASEKPEQPPSDSMEKPTEDAGNNKETKVEVDQKAKTKGELDTLPTSSTTPTTTSTNDPTCLLERHANLIPTFPAGETVKKNGFVFPGVEWRRLLCRCPKCERVYEDEQLEFLLDESDSALRYVENNYKVMEEKDEDLYRALAAETSHDVALKVKTGLIEFRQQLRTFLENSDNTKVVTKEDVENFFDGIRAKRFKPNEEDA